MEEYWDSVFFIPKRNIIFFGFGLMSNYHGKDMKIIIKWQVEDDSSEEHTLYVKDKGKDEELKWHTVDIRDFGEAPIKVAEGSKIMINAKATTQNYEE